MNPSNKKAFYVVQFMDLPYNDIHDYVCVPGTWLIKRRSTDQVAIVAYPNDEDPIDTRDRVQRKESYGEKWRFYIATVKYESDTYRDATLWIAMKIKATKRIEGPSVKEESKIIDFQSRFTTNNVQLLHSDNQRNPIMVNDNPQKPQPRKSIKRPSISTPKKQLDNKRLRLNEAVQISSVVTNGSNRKPGCSNQQQSNIILENQSMKCDQAEERQPSLRNQEDSQQQSQRPKIRICISISPKTNRHLPNLQGVSKNRPPPILGTKETGSPYRSVTSASDDSIDKEEISNKEISCDNELVEQQNNAYRTGIHTPISSVNRPTSEQTSTSKNFQLHPKDVIDRQILAKFSTLFRQMRSTLRSTYDMFYSLRSSIMESAETYKQLLNEIEQVDAANDSTSNPSPSSNRKPGVFYDTEERIREVTPRASSSYKNEPIKNGAEETTKTKHNNLWRFVLPPEYDPDDKRWTLKYQSNMPGLVELMPHSGIYISSEELQYCQQVSKNCKSLARRLLSEVFNRNALSVCSTTNEEIVQASNKNISNQRPELDDDATTALLNFVIDYGLLRGWKIVLQPILNSLNKKILKIRLKYGVMVQC